MAANYKFFCKYSGTSLKRPPKMPSLSCRLREVVLGQNLASLAYGNFKTFKVVSFKTDQSTVYVYFFFKFLSFIHVNCDKSKKKRYFSFYGTSIVLPRNAIMLKHLIIQFLLYYLSSSRLRKVKNKRKFQLLALKVVAVVYETWSLTRGSKHSDLARKRLVFWKIGR